VTERPDPVDPVRLRRARIARWAGLAKGAGYLALLVAVVGFAVGVVTGFSPTVVRVVVAALVATSVILPVPIVVGYGVRAADRDDRERFADPPPPRGQPR
jgi:hypothetical protein